MEINVFIQPDGACQHPLHHAVVPVGVVPQVVGLLPQSFDAIAAQRIQNLLTGGAIGDLGQHGKRHVDIQRRKCGVFPVIFG